MTVPTRASPLWGVATAGHRSDGDDTTSDTSFPELAAPRVARMGRGSLR
ncbi:hypothetical protein [Demequina soli]|nr:hypothetical protein [Demequina soli]